MNLIESYLHSSLPAYLIGLSTHAQNEFYRLVVADVFNSALSSPENDDDGWHGWTDSTRQPLPLDAPDSLRAQLPQGWHASFDINWLISDGDWGWDSTHPDLSGWDVHILVMGVEWINLAEGWEQQSADSTLCRLKGRKLLDGGWIIEVIPAKEIS